MVNTEIPLLRTHVRSMVRELWCGAAMKEKLERKGINLNTAEAKDASQLPLIHTSTRCKSTFI